MLWLLIYGVVPLLVFVIVDLYAGVRWAVAAAVLGALGDVILTKLSTHEWDPSSFVALGLVLLLGLVTIKLDNRVYFKLQPTAMSVFFALVLIYYQLIHGHGGLLGHYLPIIKASAPAEVRTMLEQPQFLMVMNKLLTASIGFFLIYGAVMAVIAYKATNMTWLLMRGVGFWVLFTVYGLVAAVVIGISVGKASDKDVGLKKVECPYASARISRNIEYHDRFSLSAPSPLQRSPPGDDEKRRQRVA